jgi:phage tail sheath gpL-like
MPISTAIDAGAVARVVGIKTTFKKSDSGGTTYLPQRVAVIGQGATAVSYSTTKAQYTNADAVGAAYGYGSPVHLAARQLLPLNGDGLGVVPMTIYPLTDAGSSVAAAGAITPTGSQTVAGAYVVKIGNIASPQFNIPAGTSIAASCTAIAAAINAVLHMPVTATAGATSVTLTAKWKGTTGNGMPIVIESSGTGTLVIGITNLTSGAIDPDITSTLNSFGEVWETMVLNCLGTTGSLDALQTFGEGRWGPLMRKPFVAFMGDTTVSVSSAIKSRTTDRVNAQLTCPGSKDLPLVVAARQLARIAKLANNDPPHDYGGLPADGISVGADAEQWMYADRNTAVLGGCSTIEVRNGVATISDVVTFYRPAGDTLPPYRHVVDIVKLQNCIFNFDLQFKNPEWDGAPLIPDDQPTVSPTAKRPKDYRAACAAIVNDLALDAILSDPETTNKNTQVEIDASNPKRVNVAVPIKISGNSNITSLDLNWGFYFGGLTVGA